MAIESLSRKFFIVCTAPWQMRKSLFGLFILFHRLDSHIKSFQKKSKLRCKQGCGKCCENPNIYTTVFEMIPAAIDLLRSGQSEKILSLVNERSSQGPCVFYQKDARVEGNGRCSVYLFRPLICRLFGFSVKKNKSSDYQMLTCPTIKSLFATEYQNVNSDIKQLNQAPDVQEYSMKVYSLNPLLAKEQLPINEALRIALERVGLLDKLSIKA